MTVPPEMPSEYGLEWSMVAHRVNSATPLNELDEDLRRSIINVAYTLDNAKRDGTEAGALAERERIKATLTSEDAFKIITGIRLTPEGKLRALASLIEGGKP